MAKQPKAPASETSETTETTETEVSSDTALTVAPKTQLAAPDNSMARNKALADRLPAQYREDVLFMVRPTPDQLFEIVANLPGDNQNKMMELVRKTRPKKQGAHTANEGFAPIQLKVNQGTGNDPTKPAKHPPGNFYTGDSRDMNDTIECVILGFYEGRTMWPPRDQADGAGKGPLCFSFDRKMGSRYGDCASCPNASKKYTEGGCTREVTAWVMDRDMTGIYEVKFSKSSIGGGEAMVRVMKTAKALWERWFVIKNEERTESDRRWFVTSAKPYNDPKDAAATYTDPDMHALYEGLSRLLDADVYFPALADSYDRAKGSTDTGGAISLGADEAKLLGSSVLESTPDYSGDNPNI